MKLTIFIIIAAIPIVLCLQGRIAESQSAPPIVTQGGETIETAIPITSIPFSDSGMTSGWRDDYNGPCGADSGSAPDVVYSYSPRKMKW